MRYLEEALRTLCYDSFMRYLSRRYPIEVYVLLIPSLIVLPILLAFNHLSGSSISPADLLSLAQAAAVGGSKFILGVKIIFVLAIWRLFHLMTAIRRGGISFSAVRNSLGSLFFVILLFSLPLVTIMFLTLIIYSRVSLAASLQASEMLMRWDKLIFGTYPIFSIQAWIQDAQLEQIILQTYLHLDWVMGGVLALLFIFRLHLFRVFILFFSITFAAALAISWLIPALGPGTVYLRPIFPLSVPPDIVEAQNHFLPTSQWLVVFDSLWRLWVDPTGKFLAITNFPSLHTAWALGCAYVATRLSRVLALPMLLWLVFIMIGCVYTMQHYGVDVLGGLVLGAAGIVLSEYLIRRDQDWRNTYFLFITDTQALLLSALRQLRG